MRRSVLVLACAVLLTACSGGGSRAVGSAMPVRGASASGTTPAAGLGTRLCDDPTPDRGAVDLREVSLTAMGPRLTATFRLGGPPASVAGVLQLTLGIWGVDGAARRALDVRWVDGTPRVRMYDVEQARQRALDVRPDVSGETVTVHFPAAATAGLGRSWRWEAFATVDGTDVDNCPAR